MLKIAFASSDRARVNLHFGGADSLVVYAVSPGRADLVGVGQFIKAEQAGTDVRTGLENSAQDKLLGKLSFLKDCAAVYAANIGASAIRRLMMTGIQPIIVDEGHDIVDLLDEVSLAMCCGGLAWVERAMAAAAPAEVAEPVARDGEGGTSHNLITSIDELA